MNAAVICQHHHPLTCSSSWLWLQEMTSSQMMWAEQIIPLFDLAKGFVPPDRLHDVNLPINLACGGAIRRLLASWSHTYRNASQCFVSCRDEISSRAMQSIYCYLGLEDLAQDFSACLDCRVLLPTPRPLSPTAVNSCCLTTEETSPLRKDNAASFCSRDEQ